MKCSNEFKQGHSLFQAHLWCHSGNGLLAAWLREYSGFTLEVIYVYAYVLLKEKSMLNSIWKKKNCFYTTVSGKFLYTYLFKFKLKY